MRKISLLLVIALLIAFTGCTQTKQKESKTNENSLKIGISIYDQYDTFIGEVMTELDSYVKIKETQLNRKIDVIVENADNSQTLQNTQVKDFVDAGCDVICVNLVDRTDVYAIIDTAEAADIPIIFFNRELVEQDLERWDKLYYVGAPAVESGIIQGQIVTEICRENWDRVDLNGDGVIQYVILEGEADHQDASVRTEFSVKTIASEGYELERLELEIANWHRSQAETKMAQWIQTYGTEIELVLANNDDMALGAIDALRKASLSEDYWPVIVGVDGSTVGMEAIRDGFLAGTAINDSVGQAKGIVEIACWLTCGCELPDDMQLTDGKYLRFPYKKITQEDLQ